MCIRDRIKWKNLMKKLPQMGCHLTRADFLPFESQQQNQWFFNSICKDHILKTTISKLIPKKCFSSDLKSILLNYCCCCCCYYFYFNFVFKDGIKNYQFQWIFEIIFLSNIKHFFFDFFISFIMIDVDGIPFFPFFFLLLYCKV